MTKKKTTLKKSVTPKVQKTEQVEVVAEEGKTEGLVEGGQQSGGGHDVWKKTSLTDLEKFWVEQNCKNGKSLDEVKAAGIEPIALVEACYTATDSAIKEAANNIQTSKLFGRNEKYGSVVMTQTASELGDTKKQSMEKARRAGEHKQTHIHKFRDR